MKIRMDVHLLSIRTITYASLVTGRNKREAVYFQHSKCRPPANRKPTPEALTCKSLLLFKQIEIIQPKSSARLVQQH
jgi:uracil-DNA glycosylase family 4